MYLVTITSRGCGVVVNPCRRGRTESRNGPEHIYYIPDLDISSIAYEILKVVWFACLQDHNKIPTFLHILLLQEHFEITAEINIRIPINSECRYYPQHCYYPQQRYYPQHWYYLQYWYYLI